MNPTLHRSELSDVVGQDIFKNIRFSAYITRFCSSLQSYSVCMLYERLQGEILNFAYEDIDSDAKCDILRDTVLRAELPAVTYACINAGNEGLLDNCKTKMEAVLTHQKAVSTFLSQSSDIAVFVDKNRKQTVLVASQPLVATESLIIAVLPFLVPWVFDVDSSHPVPSLTDKEKELKDLVCAPQDSDEMTSRFNAWVDSFLERVNYNTLKLQTMCARIGQEAYQQRIANAEEFIRRRTDDVRMYEDKLRNTLDEIQTQNILLNGWKEAVAAQDGGEYLSFFQAMSNVKLNDVTGGCLKFTVLTDAYINDDSMDAMQSYIERHGGIIYDYIDDDDKSDYEMLLKAIFLEDPSLYIQTQADLYVNLTGTNGGGMFGNTEAHPVSGYVPNPHLMNHNCFGTGRAIIDQYLMKGDIMNAINQCIANAGNLNPAETNIVSKFLRESVYKTKEKCLRTEDGQCLNYDEAIQWLKQRGEE